MWEFDKVNIVPGLSDNLGKVNDLGGGIVCFPAFFFFRATEDCTAFILTISGTGSILWNAESIRPCSAEPDSDLFIFFLYFF